MLERDDIAALIPHRDAMCLLERVIEWDQDTIELTTHTHRSAGNPLRLKGRLRAIHLCEYGAQAVAVHGGLRARASGGVARPGFLVSLREVSLNVDFIDGLDGELRVSARCLLESTGSWQYLFTVRHGDETLATGRAAIVARPD